MHSAALHLLLGALQAWMTRHVINTISRTQGADAVFAAAEELQRDGYAIDLSVHYALLQTCFQV